MSKTPKTGAAGCGTMIFIIAISTVVGAIAAKISTYFH